MEKILVVDDNITNLQSIRTQLDGVYTVMPVKSGEQALQAVARQIPDLILLDVEMPGMDGFETLSHLKNNNKLSHIPIIFVTATNSPEREMRALEFGAQDFLTKPFEKSVLVHRIDLHLRLSQYRRHLEHTVRELEDSIAVSFAEMIECRDENTGGHVQRTAEYMHLLGRLLREKGLFADELADSELDMMIRAAPLHDIGKIGVRDAVLLKPGKLDASEFAEMKEHSVIGASILKVMHERLPTQRYLSYAKTIAESHHERYDGKGYPYGLAGTNIPLCARIMAVVDVYDALVADRVYRPAMSHEEALGVITDGRGTNFDPSIVDILEENSAMFKGGGS